MLTNARVTRLVGGPCGDHTLAEGGLAAVERRAVDGDDQLGPGQGLLRGRPGRVPEILADVDAEADLSHA